MANIERRQHIRFAVPSKTLAITPRYLGRLLDISLEGCGVKYVGEDIRLEETEHIDILMKRSKANGCYMERLPIKIVWEDSPEFSPFSTIVVKKVGMKFNGLSSLQKQQLHSFIDNYTNLEA